MKSTKSIAKDPETVVRLLIRGTHTIPRAAFAQCHRLVELNLAHGIHVITESAFKECTAQKKVEIPPSSPHHWGVGI